MILAWIVLLFCVVLLLLMSTFLFYLVKTGMFTVPYVPTSASDMEEVLLFAKLKKGMQFVDLGCGDGRLVIKAAQEFGANATGLEINPLLVWFGRIWAKLKKVETAVFIRQDLYSFPLNNANVLYLFLFPRMMPKISAKIKKECGKGTIVISRGFELPGFKQIHMIPTKTFETYFYKV